MSNSAINDTPFFVAKLSIISNCREREHYFRVVMLQEWHDNKFQWDPEEYGGQKELYVPSEHIWLPDIVLYNK